MSDIQQEAVEELLAAAEEADPSKRSARMFRMAVKMWNSGDKIAKEECVHLLVILGEEYILGELREVLANDDALLAAAAKMVDSNSSASTPTPTAQA